MMGFNNHDLVCIDRWGLQSKDRFSADLLSLAAPGLRITGQHGSKSKA
jgi:hypothetical protein